MLSEVRGQDHSAGLFCRQLEAQRRGKHCYRTEITWVERDGVIQFASFFLSSSYRFLPLSKQGRKPSGKGPCMCSLRANNPALVHIPLRGFRLLSKCSTKTPLCICNFQVKIEKYFKIAWYMKSLSKLKTRNIAGKLKAPIYFLLHHCNTFVFSPK